MGFRVYVGVRETEPVRLLPVRVVWLALPLVAGPAASSALDGWRDAPRVTGAALLWITWGVGLVALLAPRPIGLTAVRVAAPAFVVCAIAIAIDGSASTLETIGAVGGTIAAAVLVADPAVALEAANGVAYGEERRFPLRTPTALYLVPVPLARAVVAAGIAAGPLLVADEQWALGAVALVVGLPLAWLAWRSLMLLASRWLVAVPAGFALVDPMTLADPVLMQRRNLRGVHARPGTAPIERGVTDLRLGATLGTVQIDLDGEVDLVRGGRGARQNETLRPRGVLVAVTGRGELLERARAPRAAFRD